MGRRAIFVLGLTLLLLSGGVSSAPSANSPARILNGVFSNAASVCLKWLWSLKMTNNKTVKVQRPMMKFEGGYTVDTVFDGSKLGVEPHSVEVLQSGELLILDSENSNLHRITTPLSLYSRPKLVAGSAEGSSGHVDGRLREARMNHPKGMAVDDKGNIYVADTDNMAIRKISNSGVTTIAGGKLGRGGGHVDGPGEDAKLSNDFDLVYVGSSCSLLIIDRGNKAIREIPLHFDDCAYQYGSGFPFGVGVVVAAGILGYILALLKQRTRSNVSSEDATSVTEYGDSPYQKHANNEIPPMMSSNSQAQKDTAGLLSPLVNLFATAIASAAEVIAGFIPGSRKNQALHHHDNVQLHQQQQQWYASTWPTQQDSYEIPDDEPPPPALDTGAPTPKKTYAFMSKDSEKMNQIRQSRVFYNALEQNAEPRQQLRLQQATTFESHAPQQLPSGKHTSEQHDRSQERRRRKKSVYRPDDHGTDASHQDHGDIRSRMNFSGYGY